MAKRQLPSPEVLRQLLRYDPDTGKLFWKERGPEFFSTKRACSTWNARYAGKEAMTFVMDDGHHQGAIFGVGVLAHRAAWCISYGEWPESHIDHINGDPADNRITNLRLASKAENGMNRGAPITNKSGRKGVYWNSALAKWSARIGLDRRTIYLGVFDCLDAAAEAYDRAALELHGEFARTNAMVTASEKPSTDRGRPARH